jgi:hypothetical protein
MPGRAGVFWASLKTSLLHQRYLPLAQIHYIGHLIYSDVNQFRHCRSRRDGSSEFIAIIKIGVNIFSRSHIDILRTAAGEFHSHLR